jgi:tetratricopeptide (TPR) repeat protein
MSEEATPPPPPQLHSSPRAARAEKIAFLKARRRKLHLLIGSLGGLAVALLVVLVLRSSAPTPPPPPPPATAKGLPAKPKPAPIRSGARTPAERMKELLEREKETPKAFRTLYAAWSELLREAPAELVEETREHLDRIQSAATKEFRVVYHPVNEKVRDLLGAREAREARKVLQAFQVPAELDVTGDHAADVRKQLAQIDDLVAFGDLRAKLFADYKKGEFETDAAAALKTWLESPLVHVKAEAETALVELKLMRALGLLRRKLGGRRDAALARVEAARVQIALDAEVEKARTSAWESRLKERTTKTPIPIRMLGVKDMNDQLRVLKYNGRTVTFASDRMELTLSMDELPADVFSRLIVDAPDPSKASDLLEAGRIAVRRNALPAARTLFDQAVKADRSVKDLVPDLARLAAGVGTLRAHADLQGDGLSIRYDFQNGEQLKDFKVSPGAKAVPGVGALLLEGERLFYALPGELKFSGRIRIGAEPHQILGSAGFIVGVACETAPGDPDLFVVLVQPDRGYRVIRLHRRGDQEVLGEGSLEGRGGLIEVGFDGGRSELRVGGVTAWTGSLPEFTVFQPVVGGAGFQDGTVRVGYKTLKFEGRASPEWIRRLQSERLTIIEAELSKERRVTTQERAAGGGEVRDFGDSMLTPLPLESELSELMPPRVKVSYAAGRKYLQQLETAKSEQAILKLWGQVRQSMEDAIHEAPWFPLTYFYRAEWRYLEGDNSGAMRDLLEAAGQEEGFVEARVARADLLVHDGKYAEAEKELDASLAVVPDLARARLTRALLHYYAGREADAVAELELARRLEPGDLFLRRSSKRLRNIVSGPRWSGTVAVETPHYQIRAESPKLAKKGRKDESEKTVRERTQKYADHLNGARTYFAQLVSGKESRSRKPLVYICDTPESYYTYADFTAEDRLEHTAGVYFGQYQQLLFFRAETEEETLQTMTHEAFHEYLHAVMPAAPIWLNEGMAEYASGVKIEGGRAASVGGILKGRLRNLQSALESGWEGFPFEFVVRESKEQFYSLAPELQYAQAWSMVHFLMHGKGGRYKPLLERYMTVLIETRSTAEARDVFKSADLPTIQREWLSYVKSLR